MTHSLRSLKQRDDVVALVVASNTERTFIGGRTSGDVSARLSPSSARSFMTGLFELCEEVRNFPVPTIARIHSWCLGVGLEFVAACDIRVASSEARFAMRLARAERGYISSAAVFTQRLPYCSEIEPVRQSRAASQLRWSDGHITLLNSVIP